MIPCGGNRYAAAYTLFAFQILYYLNFDDFIHTVSSNSICRMHFPLVQFDVWT